MSKLIEILLFILSMVLLMTKIKLPITPTAFLLALLLNGICLIIGQPLLEWLFASEPSVVMGYNITVISLILPTFLLMKIILKLRNHEQESTN